MAKVKTRNEIQLAIKPRNVWSRSARHHTEAKWLKPRMTLAIRPVNR